MIPLTKTQTWWLYVVRRADHALYTGIALDTGKRFAQHCAGDGAKALRGRGPLSLVFRRRIGAIGDALRVERAFKKLPKAAKEQLIAQPRRWRAWLAGGRRDSTGASSDPVGTRAGPARASSANRRRRGPSTRRPT